MPLALFSSGQEGQIRKIQGKDEAKRFLEGLGFVIGEPVKVVAALGGNLIVEMKGTRVALSREMAKRIIA